MRVYEKMVAIGERAKISLRLAVFLTLCVSLSSSEVNSCSQDLANIQCRGRCAAAATTNSIPFSNCVQRCCGSGGQGSTLPEDCPLQGLNCSKTPNTVNISSVAWKGNGLEFHYNTSTLETGRDACNMVQNDSIPDGLLPLIVSAGIDNVTSHFWILFPGQSNKLLLPDVGSCNSLSIAAVNECEMQELSTTDVIPPKVSLTVTSLMATANEDLLPVVTVAWQLEEVQPITDIVYNVSLVENPLLPPKNECVTASKALSQTDLLANSIDFYPEDFQGYSVWLCIYDVILPACSEVLELPSHLFTYEVSMSYKAMCGESTGLESDVLEEKQVLILEGPILSTSFSFYWNQSTLSYVIHINWTVPLLYDIPHLVKLFRLSKAEVKHGIPFPSIGTFDLFIPATGDISYQITIQSYSPSQVDQYFFLIAGFGDISHPPPTTAVFIGPLKLPGEPPSVVIVTNITETMQEGVRVMWMAPNITNGKILSYIVEVKMLTKGRQSVYAHNYTVTEALSFSFNFTGVERALVDRVLVRVAARNNFSQGPFSESVYLGLQAPPRTSNLQEVVAAVVVPVVVTVAGILVVLLIIGVLIYMRQKLARPSKLDDGRLGLVDAKPLDPSLYDYSPYFTSKLPPAMVDRWIIPLQMFNSENFYLIGRGNFSTVYFSTIQGPLPTPTQLEQYKNYSEQGVAVKLLNGKSSEQQIQSFINEAEVMKHLSAQSCNYVVQLVGLQLEQVPAMIAMEMVSCGNLLDILKNSSIVEEETVFADTTTSGFTYVKKPVERGDSQLTLVEFQKERSGSIDSYVQLRKLSLVTDDGYAAPDQKIAIKPSQLLKFAIQVVRGMEYVASCDIVHRDLACRNLLLTGNGIVKVSDFGFACTLDGKEYIIEDLPVESKPLRWMSPEAFEQNVYSEASDVWSFGVTLWEIFSQGLFPYPALSDHEVLAAVKCGNYLDCPEICGSKVYKVMTSCWALSANERPKFADMRGPLEAFMYDLYPYMLMEVEEEPSTQSQDA